MIWHVAVFGSNEPSVNLGLNVQSTLQLSDEYEGVHAIEFGVLTSCSD